MPSFGTNSRKHRDSCEEELKKVLNEAIKSFDFSCIWGHRGMEAQNKAFNEGHSTKRWPNSKHNRFPSSAFDVIPYPKGFDASHGEFYEMATYIMQSAIKLGVRVRWGGHWKNPKDMAHFELME